RLNTDGTLDATFGTHGTTSFRVPESAYDQLNDLAIDQQGRIVAVGSDRVIAGSSGLVDTLVMRLNQDGSLDTSFNGTGYTVIPVSPGGYDYAQSVALQDMGPGLPQKIVFAGRAPNPNGSGDDFVVGRLNDDGSLDPTFGGTGVVQQNVNQN